MSMPIVIVRWDEASNPPPLYKVVRYLKSNPAITFDIVTIASGDSNYEIQDYTIDESSFYNRVWIYKIISLCDDASSRPFLTSEFILITCDLILTTAATNNSIPYSFYALGGDINRYTIKLYNSLAEQIGVTQTKNTPFTTPITGTFTGLNPNEIYTLVITPSIIGTSYSKDCSADVQTEEDADTFSITHTNATPVSNIQLTIGNNNGSPSTYIYSGAYVVTPITGTDPSNLPTVNANVMLYVTGSPKVLSMTCNGVGTTVTDGNRGQWSGVNGSLDVSFITTSQSYLNWTFSEVGSASGSFDIYVNGIIVLHRTIPGTGSIPVNFNDTVNVVLLTGSYTGALSVDNTIDGSLYSTSGTIDPSYAFIADEGNYTISGIIS